MKAHEGTPLCGWSLPFLIQTAVTLLGGALHLWTGIRVFWLGGGVLLSTVALFLPGISEIAVGAVSCGISRWGNPYCLALLSY